MRADLMKWLAPKLGARATVLLVLTSDHEAHKNKTGGEWGQNYRTLKNLQEYNPRIDKKTMWSLVKEGLIEPEKYGWRIKLE